MSAPPKWIDGKLVCQHPGCGRVMYRRGRSCMCEQWKHGGVFTVPDKPPRSERVKVERELDPVQKWKATLPVARSVYRKHILTKNHRTSFGVWRVDGYDGCEWRLERYDVRETDEVPAGFVVARFWRTRYAARTVLLKPVQKVGEA